MTTRSSTAPTVEWEWGDLTQSIAEADCDPYAPGKSEIKRRYTVEHQFKNPGAFKVVLRLKKGSKVVATAQARRSRSAPASDSKPDDPGASEIVRTP